MPLDSEHGVTGTSEPGQRGLLGSGMHIRAPLTQHGAAPHVVAVTGGQLPPDTSRPFLRGLQLPVEREGHVALWEAPALKSGDRKPEFQLHLLLAGCPEISDLPP